MRYTPVEVVTAFVTTLVVNCVAVTSTLGITAPLLSMIWPVMLPRAPCAKAGATKHMSVIKRTESENNLVFTVILPLHELPIDLNGEGKHMPYHSAALVFSSSWRV